MGRLRSQAEPMTSTFLHDCLSETAGPSRRPVHPSHASRAALQCSPSPARPGHPSGRIQSPTIAALLALLLALPACVTDAPKVVLVPPIVWVDGEPTNLVQLAEPVQARVYVTIDGQRVQSSNRVTIPEGWLAGPPPPKETSP